MSTVIGDRMLSGGAVKYHRGQGIARNIASSVIGSVGNALVSAIAKKVKGDGFKVTGMGKKKAGRPKKTNKKKK